MAKEMKPKYTPSATALDAVVCMFFTQRSVAKSISSPLSPAAAAILCLVEQAGKDGLTEFHARLGLRFAFDREEADRIVEAGFEKAVKAGFAELRPAKKEGDLPTLHLTGQGMLLIDNLNRVFKEG
ncbi:hypothetical protein [Cupriavidus taiwanensis]|uniref:hypothetical protein n=1 Tax=Cupriavidus taiwanensis TaxID=164546 RepID=UPI000E103566|nr:hypothetical protein [Cupriavidus taiwanensis]SOY48534.1 hypothetical protein CBM2592_A190040 [Cupriavidus taiwanensis]SOY83064.1 hypothetical protein CBM2591_A230042 [Cupriavidus taiwanensis]SOZ56270.1 hypothetical protein CBM2617_A200049 [Cupriavidus taiwanensis]SOZ78836.1 hypothetical protein CBM2618_A180051 [Cupriavidus taiwanensis]SOZ79112.1 hypothetical protein CBM2622_A170049 [Cupriavidus taiwanensis]